MLGADGNSFLFGILWLWNFGVVDIDGSERRSSQHRHKISPKRILPETMKNRGRGFHV